MMCSSAQQCAAEDATDWDSKADAQRDGKAQDEEAWPVERKCGDACRMAPVVGAGLILIKEPRHLLQEPCE